MFVPDMSSGARRRQINLNRGQGLTQMCSTKKALSFLVVLLIVWIVSGNAIHGLAKTNHEFAPSGISFNATSKSLMLVTPQPDPLPTPSPTPPPPGIEGQIVFAQWTDGKQYELYVVNADGSAPPRRITYNTEGDTSIVPAESDQPVWSPNNQKIAFRIVGPSAPNGIYLINPDGTNQTRVASGYVAYPTWSADGTKLAFTNEFDIFVVNADGSNLTKITSSPRLEKVQSTWSPDGTAIAFSLVNLDTQTSFDIYSIRPDGTMLRNLTNNSSTETEPAWSPDGKQIAYTKWLGGGVLEIWIMNADGSNQHSLATRAFGHEATWSSDGTKIAFIGQDSMRTLYVMNADGSNQHPLVGNQLGFLSQDSFATLKLTGNHIQVAQSSTSSPTNATPNWQRLEVFVPVGPFLLREQGSTRAIGLHSVTLTRGPLPVLTSQNLSQDHHTRVTLLAGNVGLQPNEDSSIVTAQVEVPTGNVYPLAVEYVGRVPGFDWLTQVNVILPEQLEGAGDLLLSINVRGVISNRVLVSIK
jgi:WD40 repeat protein